MVYFMSKREFLTIGSILIGFLCLLLSGCPTIFTIRPAGDKAPPTMSNPSVNPRMIRFTGGQVVISATVTDNVAVSSVKAVITKPDNSTEEKPMTAAGNNNYETTYQASANTSNNNQNQIYQVKIKASDTSNNPSEVIAGSFTVEAATAPPQEPTL